MTKLRGIAGEPGPKHIALQQLDILRNRVADLDADGPATPSDRRLLAFLLDQLAIARARDERLAGAFDAVDAAVALLVDGLPPDTTRPGLMSAAQRREIVPRVLATIEAAKVALRTTISADTFDGELPGS
jgi:hypothetical protein